MADPVGADLWASTHSPRPAPMDREPGERLGRTLSLLDDIDRTARRLQPLLRTVERMTGLPPTQVSTLMAFADSGQMSVGTTEDATALTALARKGLIASGRAAPGGGPGGGPGGTDWRLTDAGWGALEQVQGLRIRALGTIVNTLDDSQVEEIRDTLRGIGDALQSLRPTDAGTPRSD